MSENPFMGTCDECRFWRLIGKNHMNIGAPDQGECRRKTPSLVTMADPQTGNMTTASAWPPTMANQFCGEGAPGAPRKQEDPNRPDGGKPPGPKLAS